MPRKQNATSSSFNAPFPTAFRKLMEGSNNGKRNQFSQQEVADAIGKTRQTVGYYLDGSVKPDIDTIAKIADFFDVTTDFLLGRSAFSDAKLRLLTLENFGFSQRAVHSISHMHATKFLKERNPTDLRGFFTGKEFDMLVQLLEESSFADFLGKAAIYTDFRVPERASVTGAISTATDCYKLETSAGVLKSVFMQQAVTALTEALNNIANAREKEECSNGENGQ